MIEKSNMEKRIFLCAERFFPRGDAGANRVLYIAKAIQNAGWSVVVLSIGKNDERHYDAETGVYCYDGVPYENIVCQTNGNIQKVERLLFNGNKTVNLLKKHHLSRQDKVLIYSSTAGYVGPVLKYAQKEIGAAVAVDVVEWHQPFQFKFGKYDPRYISFSTCFNHLFVKAKNVVVISELLKNHFEFKNCNVLKLPIYIDPQASYDYTPETERLNLIYPGNPYRKDSLETMLEALKLLNEREREKVYLHLTGVTRSLLEKSVQGKEYLLDMSCVKIHGWMEYRELIALYKGIDFALIARPDNIVTNANFPSKVPELMNRGIPVIINQIGDIQEYLQKDLNTVFIEECSAEACSKAIKACLNKRKTDIMEMHKKAFESAALQFDYRTSSRKLDEFFLGLK